LRCPFGVVSEASNNCGVIGTVDGTLARLGFAINS
jgi:hypothetical protein